MGFSSATTADQIVTQYGLANDDEFASLPTVERSLYRAAYAADVLHVVEGAAYDPSTGEFTPGPPYNNVGPDVNRYLEACGVDPGNPWCAAFGSTMLMDSGVSRSKLPDGCASVHEWLDWARANGSLTETPARGRAGLIIESPTAGHFVLVSGGDGDTVSTIEGNTNNDGSRDGYAVLRKTRPVSEFVGFVDLPSKFN